ncbi:MAG: sulfotransferase [Phycisphaerae bacterium]|nr:sulfotransferase [Phycisphaerae bacterium]
MPDLQTSFLNAVNARKAGNAARSRELFNELIREHPTCHEAHYMLGMLSAELSDLTTAQKHLERAIELDKGNPEYLFKLGAVLLSLGRAEQAVPILEEAVREADETPALMLTLGSACLAAVKLPDAERAFNRARELDPTAAEPGMGLLATLMASRRMEEAQALARQLAAAHPRRADVQARLAQTLERSNKLEEAAPAADAALAINPNEPTALGVRATLLQRAGKKEESIPVFRKAIDATTSTQERRDLSRSLGLVLDELERHEEAFPLFLKSKKTAAEIPASSSMLASDVERFIKACKRELTPGVVSTWHRPPPDARQPPVFFVGFPRSGTTLLEQVLGAHPRLVTTDEIESIGACTEWVGQRAGRLDLAPAAYASLTDAEIIALRDRYWNRITAELGADALAGKRLVDKHPMNTVNLFTARRIFPDAKVIVSIRDPRDVILSCFMHLSRTPMAVVYFKDLESAARLYERVMGLWFHMRTALGLPWIEVKYEDLVDDAEGTARKVLDFLGEPWDDSVLRFTERSRQKTMRSTSYQQVSQGLYTRAKGRWRAYEKHFGDAIEILEPYVQALGYADR